MASGQPGVQSESRIVKAIHRETLLQKLPSLSHVSSRVWQTFPGRTHRPNRGSCGTFYQRCGVRHRGRNSGDTGTSYPCCPEAVRGGSLAAKDRNREAGQEWKVGLALLRTGPTPDAHKDTEARRARQVVPQGTGKPGGCCYGAGNQRLMLGTSGEQAGEKLCPG